MGCTTGAKIFEEEKTLVVFKNKDFRVKKYSDQLIAEYSHAFRIKGVNLETRNIA